MDSPCRAWHKCKHRDCLNCTDNKYFAEILKESEPMRTPTEHDDEFADTESPTSEPLMREFDTGATRNTDAGKLDYEGFLSPLALECYARYLDNHRTQANGKVRDSDNWQKGIPVDVYMKSAFRHFFDVWKGHRGLQIYDGTHQDALCATIFNLMGYLHEIEREELYTFCKGAKS